MIITIPRRKSIDCTLVTEVTLLVIVDVVIGRGFEQMKTKLKLEPFVALFFSQGI